MSTDVATRDHFDETHARRDDPWGVTTRWYEIRKRALTLASLPDEHYETVLEIGCSTGVVTEALAERAGSVTAVDVSAEAVRRARERVSPHPNVTVAQHDVNDGLPPGRWDLVVLSEVGYYLSTPDYTELVEHIEQALNPAGVLLLCHWRHDEPDFLQSGDTAHRIVAFETGLDRIVHHEEADFVLDVYSTDPRSVAQRTGLR